jgi:hypothetical protein
VSSRRYIRGANYIWHDDDRVHVWAADGLHNWQDSGWIEDVQSQQPARPVDTGPSGVAVNQDVADLYVVMRFAELVRQRRVREIVERAVSSYGNNGGCLALRELAPALLRSVDNLAPGDEQK